MGGVKRDVSSSLTRGINAKRLCTRLKKKDGQMCELKYDKKFDPKTVRARPPNAADAANAADSTTAAARALRRAGETKVPPRAEDAVAWPIDHEPP